MIFGILNKKMVELKETVVYFVVGIKTFEISEFFLNRILTKNVINFEILRQIFPQRQQISLRAL